ncbi:SiaB family protein kinase [Ectothiorhodospira lacustris]|uniref:SiaB family protein kinase n=1 Tax=Ectothiorhodospira lacustris TaxID=2899127 RepID=UPI001EE89777|nr:SiaB family protein kinase [Ectothiorhodospira lacustris]MCG5501998.1 SiaB family protein kinase [Ectothiorhodospira lacustris]MCG5509521.1 SiaB family protein kinase [Ectothiorhodospira lacustris]MCG5521684.1 SiaB family protein kinase [Ectothiorhodospira lacustris]
MNQYLSPCHDHDECIIRNQGLVFYYVGYFSQNIINAIGDAVRLRLECSETPGSLRRKIFSIFIEMAQNIVHYSSDQLTRGADEDHVMRAGSVCITQEEGRFMIICKNPVTPEWAQQLRQDLEALRVMSMDQIRQSYREQLRKAAPEHSKGAGLGLLTIARDSSGPIEFALEPDSAGDVMFTLKATL